MKGIYKFTCKNNGKVYIGQSLNIEGRFKAHVNNHINKNLKGDYQTKFYRALRKYGIENFSFEIVEIVEDTKDLNEKEAYWIKQYKSFSDGYNSTPGGDAVTGGNELHPNAKNTNLDVLELKRKLVETTISQGDLANEYNVTQSTVSLINLGSRWGSLGNFDYPLRKKEARRSGEKNPRTVLTDDIVGTIRKRYQNETGKQIYDDYKDLCSYTTFERALTGRTYKYLPLYKKKEKMWIDNPVSTIPEVEMLGSKDTD